MLSSVTPTALSVNLGLNVTERIELAFLVLSTVDVYEPACLSLKINL